MSLSMIRVWLKEVEKRPPMVMINCREISGRRAATEIYQVFCQRVAPSSSAASYSSTSTRDRAAR